MKKTIETIGGRVYHGVEQLDNHEAVAAGVQTPSSTPFGPHGSDRFWDTGAPVPPFPPLLGVPFMGPKTRLYASPDRPHPYTDLIQEAAVFFRQEKNPECKDQHHTLWRLLNGINLKHQRKETRLLQVSPFEIWGVVPWRAGCPLRGGAWFFSKDLAEQFRPALSLGWKSWTMFTRAHDSGLTFGLVGPLSTQEYVKLMAGGLTIGAIETLLHGKVQFPKGSDDMLELDQAKVRADQIVEEIFVQYENAYPAQARQLLWDDLRNIERFPQYWLHVNDEERYPHHQDVLTSLQDPVTYEESPPKAWTCAAVVPWIEFTEKKGPGTMLQQPNLFPVAWFEHTGLACQYAMNLSFQVGHIAGRPPEGYERPWMFQTFYVYERFPLRALFSPQQGPAWCKTRPFSFGASLTHGGVQILVSESGFSRDNAEIPMTAEDERKLIGSIVDKDGQKLTLSSLDAPPTPQTSAAMEEDGDDVLEAFTS